MHALLTRTARKAAALAAAASLLAAPAAFAAEPPVAPPEAPAADLGSYKVVAVQPVLATGGAQDPLWTALGYVLGAAPVTASAEGRAATAKLAAPEVQARGLGFAGKATEGDVRILRNGAALGFGLLMLVLEDPKAPELFQKLQGAQGDFATLTPDVQRLVAKIVAIGAGAQQGDLGPLYAQLLEAASTGIATATADDPAPARAHGYLTAGLWASLAMVGSLKGNGSAFAGMAEPIAMMLDEDASFGGADRALAATIRAMGAELAKPEASFEALSASLDAVFKVQAD